MISPHLPLPSTQSVADKCCYCIRFCMSSRATNRLTPPLAAGSGYLTVFGNLQPLSYLHHGRTDPPGAPILAFKHPAANHARTVISSIHLLYSTYPPYPTCMRVRYVERSLRHRRLAPCVRSATSPISFNVVSRNTITERDLLA